MKSIKITKLKILLKNILPISVVKIILKRKHRLLINEIKELKVINRGSIKNYNWVELSCGTKFVGPKSSKAHELIFNSFHKELNNFKKDDLVILMEIVNRYKFPRNIPGESGHLPPKYKPLRDPLNDFDLSFDEREKLIQIFKPKPGDVFVDIGAYMGYGTIKVAQLVGETGTVYAFEADKDNFEVLRLNVKENNIKNVVLVPCAAGSVNGDQVFHKTDGTANSLSVSTLKLLGSENIVSEVVKTRRVDDVLKNDGHKEIDYLNITVNGSEHDVLMGIEDLISRSSNIRLTLAGWYFVDKNNKVADLVMPMLKKMKIHNMRGNLGRVIGWAD